MRILPSRADIKEQMERWRTDPELSRSAATLRNMGEDLLHYKYVARPLNRLLGGPFRPLTSALGTTYLTDIAMHQLVPLTIQAIALRNVRALVPYPTLSTYQLVTMGYPAAVMKLSRLPQHLVLRNIAAVLLPDSDASLRDALVTRAAAFLKQHPNRHPELLKDSFLEFVTSIEFALSGHAQLFLHELRAQAPKAKAQGEALWSAMEIYHDSRTDADFEALIAALAGCFPIGHARVSPDEVSALLVRDAVQASLIGVLVLAQWINLADRVMQGEMAACLEVSTAAVFLGVALALTNAPTHLPPAIAGARR